MTATVTVTVTLTITLTVNVTVNVNVDVDVNENENVHAYVGDEGREGGEKWRRDVCACGEVVVVVVRTRCYHVRVCPCTCTRATDSEKRANDSALAPSPGLTKRQPYACASREQVPGVQ